MRLAARNLSAVYEAPGGGTLPVLDNVTFGIDVGAFVCLVGPSGSGKTTLIRLLAGLQRPTQGQALLDGAVVSGPSRQVGLMFQEANLMPWRTVEDNIALPLEIAGIARDERNAVVQQLLPTLGLSEFAQAYPAELSGGMAQRVALGRVLIQRPDVLLMDEPFGALDALTREQVSFDLLRLWAEHRQTVLMVTHNIHEAVLLADRILVLSRRPGSLVADIAVLLKRPRSLDDTYTDAFGKTAQAVRTAIVQE